MSKLKLEKITGVVALSYLVLIPVGAFYAWQKIRAVDNDLTVVWDNLKIPSEKSSPTFSFGNLFRGRQ